MERLKHDTPFDVVVVGGGCVGAGAALDAAARGLRVALVERGDYGSETSSRSTKLLWAGIRYLATAAAGLLRRESLAQPMKALRDFGSEFRMVLNCHRERRFMIEQQPHLCHWMPIALPFDRWWVSPAALWAPVVLALPGAVAVGHDVLRLAVVLHVPAVVCGRPQGGAAAVPPMLYKTKDCSSQRSFATRS